MTFALTPEERDVRDQDIVRLFHAGMTYRQLGGRFGLSVSAIHKVMRKHGTALTRDEITRRRANPRMPKVEWTPEMNRALILTRIEGGTVQKCAKVVGVGHCLAWRKLAEYGLAGKAAA